MRARRWANTLVVLGGLCWAGCTTVNVGSKETAAGGAAECPVGSLGCACTPGGGCDTPLECMAGTCSATSGLGGHPEASGGLGSTPDGSPGSGSTPSDAGSSAGGSSGGNTAPPAECLLDPALVAPEGDFYSEPTGGDWPDCVSACTRRYVRQPFDVVLPEPNSGTRVVIGNSEYDGLRGVLDAADHAPFASDRDYFRVVVPAATLVEMSAIPAGPRSCIDPHLSTVDPALNQPAQGLMTVNDDRAEGDRSARTVLAAPFDGPGHWFVVVEDARTLLGQFQAGGADYDYLLRFRTHGPLKYGELSVSEESGVVEALGAELVLAGDIHYYRFVDPLRRAHIVRFSTANRSFCGHLWQIDPAGQARWLSSGVTGVPPCADSLEWTTNSAFYDASDGYAFVVTDANGLGSNSGHGDFSYDVRVSRAN